MPHLQSPSELCAGLDKLEYLLAKRERRFWTRKLWRVRRMRLYKRWRHLYWRCLYQYFHFRTALRTIRQAAKPPRS